MFYHHSFLLIFFFFNDTATTEIYTLSLHDALPISSPGPESRVSRVRAVRSSRRAGVHRDVLGRDQDRRGPGPGQHADRSEEHTSELQSLAYLVCRLLLEKKKKITIK